MANHGPWWLSRGKSTLLTQSLACGATDYLEELASLWFLVPCQEIKTTLKINDACNILIRIPGTRGSPQQLQLLKVYSDDPTPYILTPYSRSRREKCCNKHFWFLSSPLAYAPGREGVTCLLGEIKENWVNPVGHSCQEPGPWVDMVTFLSLLPSGPAHHHPLRSGAALERADHGMCNSERRAAVQFYEGFLGFGWLFDLI